MIDLPVVASHVNETKVEFMSFVRFRAEVDAEALARATCAIQFCPAGSVLLDGALPGGVKSLSRLLLRSLTPVEIKSGGGGVTVYAEDGTFPRIFMGVDRPCRARKYGEGERLVTVVSASTKSGVGARLGVPRLGVGNLWLLMLEDGTPGDLPESSGFDVLRL